MEKRTLPLLLLPAAFVILTYQNCSHFDSNSTGLSSTLTSVQSDMGPGAAAPSTPQPNPQPAPSPVNSANLIWGDEFNTFSLYNPSTKTGNWQGASLNQQESGAGWGDEYDIGPMDTSFGVNPVTVANGMLTIRTDKAPAALLPKLDGKKYTSGAIRTVNPSFGYAYYEMRAQLPKGNGLWPAFWLLPADGGWPPEIDIIEGLGNEPNIFNATVHSQKSFPNAVSYYSGHYQSTKGDINVGVDMTAGYHTYGCDFRADYITWYFDGKQIYRSATPSDLVNRKVYIIFDTAIGGWNNNEVDKTTVFPTDYNIDYVRVYKTMP